LRQFLVKIELNAARGSMSPNSSKTPANGR
jgi:hypothetical protein